MSRFAERTNWNLENNRLSEALTRHRALGRNVLDLTVSNPTACGFAYDGKAILQALNDPASLTYEPDPRGLEAARRAVADYYAERGESVAAEDVLLTTGTSEAYSFVFRLLCNPGDELLVPAPSYPLLDFLAEIHDVRLVRYPLVYDQRWEIDLPALEQTIGQRTRGVVVVHPNNPTGHFCKPGDRKRLDEIGSGRQIALIADEVFLDFALTGERTASFARNGGALTFVLSGVSKISGLPQMKLGWLMLGGTEERKRLALARLEVISDSYLSLSTPIQRAAGVLLEQRHGFQKELLRRVRGNLAELDRQLAGQKSCSRLVVEGGWNVVLRVPATRPDEELAIELLAQRDVYVHPGHFYSFASDGFLVVSLIPPEEQFAEGVKRLLSLF